MERMSRSGTKARDPEKEEGTISTRYLTDLVTSLNSLSEEREARWRKEQHEREVQLKLEVEEHEHKRLEAAVYAELREEQLKPEHRRRRERPEKGRMMSIWCSDVI